MRIIIQFEPGDLESFERAQRAARATVRSADESELVDTAKHTLDGLALGGAPAYIRDRIAKVQRLIQMLEDEEWALTARYREEVVAALVYFSDPDDLIPDHIPVIGLLDDAIMLEMLIRKEKDLLTAYDRFCTYRAKLGPVPAELTDRKMWCQKLRAKRKKLMDRVKERRAGQ
jgi:uncharacterized membrane protein YkvA (DUF1232 family)